MTQENSNPRISRTDSLRAKLNIRTAAVAMAAHKSPAAKLAAEPGFDAIWDPGKTQNTGPICPKNGRGK
jgi:2-methylisocitrate lyase-like PEP mutase family enzyme